MLRGKKKNHVEEEGVNVVVERLVVEEELEKERGGASRGEKVSRNGQSCKRGRQRGEAASRE